MSLVNRSTLFLEHGICDVVPVQVVDSRWNHQAVEFMRKRVDLVLGGYLDLLQVADVSFSQGAYLSGDGLENRTPRPNTMNFFRMGRLAKVMNSMMRFIGCLSVAWIS